MKAFKANRAVTIHSGRIGLTLDQADARLQSKSIEPVSDQEGVYNVLLPLQFKAGEIVVIDDEIGKALKAQLDEPSQGDLEKHRRDYEEQRQSRVNAADRAKHALEAKRDEQLAKRASRTTNKQAAAAASEQQRLDDVKKAPAQAQNVSTAHANVSPPGTPTPGGVHQNTSEIEKR